MARPSHAVVARQVLEASLIMMALVLMGSVARELYVAVARPRRGWVIPARKTSWAAALGLGLAAGVAEAVYAYSGMRDRDCRDYADTKLPAKHSEQRRD